MSGVAASSIVALLPDGWRGKTLHNPDARYPWEHPYDLGDTETLAFYLGVCVGGAYGTTREMAARRLIRLHRENQALRAALGLRP